MVNEEIFLVAVPGLEGPLAAEAAALGFAGVKQVPGGVVCSGDLAEAARANVVLRCAVRVLLRVAEFRVMHLAQLDKRAKKVAWTEVLQAGVPVRVEAVCRRSKIYVNKAAVQRIAGGLEAAGIPVAKEAAITVKARIDDDLCTISVDTTGEALHRRGHKEFVGKAPMRETMAAGFLAEKGFDGSQAVVDPMCGSGTFVIEAAEMALGLMPGRSRGFAFEQMAGGSALGGDRSLRRGYLKNGEAGEDAPLRPMFFGFDRNDGAIRGAVKNAERAGVAELVRFERQAISDLTPPDGVAPGIVIVNPPYGGRIGERKLLFGLYGAMGATLAEAFRGWQIGIITSDGGLAKATGLELTAFGPVDHSGTKISMWQAQL
ncbi:THUMP domain-containing class I SAM-dependent RNA methyltransferase [Gymnodinialimonas ceratoperidinii]|uniref:Class I SAM-dependent RNA methyltransferase n=1 Tax=Gymnodinialimonas ceratoperidinii TaxID=2856823 RepID=A0A8F6TWW0_9RHOB|nr:class I SAM-dependent RNA methyltransferase [Gymnodinialimonas ceratoperidinii]QXT39913.1 class I SAM-dependent RNA methyltransferase [Gymnodinialimonas ceratoperidinii]